MIKLVKSQEKGGEDMRKTLAKIGSGLAVGVAVFYGNVVAVLANARSPLCPDPTQTGITPPGCAGTPPGPGELITFVVNILLFASFIIALVFLIIGGIRWIMSGGDKDGANKAKETVTSALIGLAVVLASWILINVIINVLTGGSVASIQIPRLVIPGATK